MDVTKLVFELRKGREAKYVAEKEAEVAKSKSSDVGNLEELKRQWVQEGIDQCADDVVGLRVYQAGYDFALYKMSLPSNYELRIIVQRPDELGLEAEEDADQVVDANPPLET